jgi:hypothetical protein
MDTHAGHVTYFLSQIPPLRNGQAMTPQMIEATRAAIDRDWLDVDFLKVTLTWLKESAEAVNGLACAGWLEYVEGYRQLADEHLTVAVARHLVRCSVRSWPHSAKASTPASAIALCEDPFRAQGRTRGGRSMPCAPRNAPATRARERAASSRVTRML